MASDIVQIVLAVHKSVVDGKIDGDRNSEDWFLDTPAVMFPDSCSCGYQIDH